MFSTNGTYTIQRGYILDAGIVPSNCQDEFDAVIRETFPDVLWQGKHYHLNGPGAPDLLAVQSFVEWLDGVAAYPPTSEVVT